MFRWVRHTWSVYSLKGIHRINDEQQRKFHVIFNQVIVFFITQLLIVVAGVSVVHMLLAMNPALHSQLTASVDEYLVAYMVPVVFSIGCFILIYHIRLHSRYTVAWTWLAILIGQLFLSLYVLFLGTASGFHFYFYVITPLPFFAIPISRHKTVWLLVALLVICNVSTHVALQYIEPLFPLPAGFNRVLYYMVAFFSVLGVIFCAYYLWLQSFRSEIKIINARQRLRAQAHRLADMNADLTRKDELLQIELQLAARAQSTIFPPEEGQLDRVSYTSLFKPVHRVSGDYFDCTLKDGRAFFLIADISGHGVPAALFSMLAHHTFTSSIQADDTPADILRRSNQMLTDLITTDDYITAFLIKVDQGRVQYCNGGHNRPVFIPADHSRPLQLLDSHGLPLGSLKEADRYYENGHIDIEAGDRILLYTDALTEQEGDGGPWEEKRLLEHIEELRSQTGAAESLPARLFDLWTAHRGKVKQADDLTMLLLQLNAQTG